MTAPIVLTVDGVVKSQGSKTAVRAKGGRGVVMLDGKTKTARQAFATWRDAVSSTARLWLERNGRPAPLDGALAVSITFRLPRPKSAPKRITRPHTGLDIDKAARAVLDSLTGLIYVDDARICDLTLTKRFAVDEPTGATITIERCAE